MLEQVPPGE